MVHSTTPSDALFQEQLRIEARMAELGIERYERTALEAVQDGEATRSRAVKAVLDTALDLVEEGLVGFLAGAKTGKAGRLHTAAKLLDGGPTRPAAFIALKLTLDGFARDRPLTTIASQIGRQLEMEQRVAKFAEEDPDYYRSLERDLDTRTNHARHRRAVFSRVLTKRGHEWDPWGDASCLRVGVKMLEIVASTTGLFEFVPVHANHKTVMVVSATERFKSWIATLDKQFSILSPLHYPCVVPPKDWQGLTGGGYWTEDPVRPVEFVKTRSKLHKEELRKADLGQVYAAVNAIQRTPWEVNRRVLEVAEALVDAGRAVGGLPSPDDLPLPAKPADIGENEEATVRWKREAAMVHNQNRSLVSRRLSVYRTLAVAKEFQKYDAIYFPHQLDFRGRIYPIPQDLNPQGNDLAKGLLHFAEGDPLDNELAVRWFEIHGANCYGVDKVTFTDRRGWVEQNAENIFRSADDPLGFQWWADADSPFCFLAWCMEYRDWADGGCSRDFISRVPVAMDGSCNGLQHYSAMLRDPRGAAATNLIPSDKPQDIYQEVADEVVRKLYARIDSGAEDAALADRWLSFGIDRNLTKRPVMVLPYGGTRNSCHKYVMEVALDRGASSLFSMEEMFLATSWLADVVWESIGTVVVAARLGMGWLRDVASVVTKEGTPLVWDTPSGFRVVQDYPEMGKTQIKTALFGKRFDPSLSYAREGTVDRRRQVNGVAPNFVHSLDASALVATVNRAVASGITKFAMIHDSYGTTAGDASALSGHLRDAFVEMYEGGDTLERFAADVVPPHLQDKVASPPTVGGLDLAAVKESAYFFA